MLKNKILPLFIAVVALPLGAQAQPVNPVLQNPLTYADMVDLSEASQLVIHAQIRRQIEVEPERSPGLEAGFARLYIEAETLALIAGNITVGESLRYLVDVPRDAKGKAPKLKNSEVILFAKPVAGRAGEVQLAGVQGQFAYAPDFLDRLRPVLASLVAPDVPPVVNSVRDALSVSGNLTGESETQIFLDTDDGSPVSITVLRRPGRPAAWGVSWGEIIDQSALPPRPGTLEWYRLACALPATLSSSANLSRDPRERQMAQRDYALVIESLGPCERNLN
jgi:hypothetical protein